MRIKTLSSIFYPSVLIFPMITGCGDNQKQSSVTPGIRQEHKNLLIKENTKSHLKSFAKKSSLIYEKASKELGHKPFKDLSSDEKQRFFFYLNDELTKSFADQPQVQRHNDKANAYLDILAGLLKMAAQDPELLARAQTYDFNIHHLLKILELCFLYAPQELAENLGEEILTKPSSMEEKFQAVKSFILEAIEQFT